MSAGGTVVGAGGTVVGAGGTVVGTTARATASRGRKPKDCTTQKGHLTRSGNPFFHSNIKFRYLPNFSYINW